ncbi:MAG TPA: ligand-gated channel protein, partial [Bradyrhizobium sp.]|nr:ligand-gated channel protein [Bradyrhizobium sp.]
MVSPPKPQSATLPGGEPQGTRKRAKRTARNTSAKPAPASSPGPSNPQGLPTPLNTNVVAGSSNLLGLTVFQTPASIQVVSQETMREQGYRTTPETA